ncbi:FtsK/SpoIIIE family DNA translocase [Aureliella helgolandensis]|uniref:DNA translocase FtsK n=1 Tax=Aureliella helgolandensis TaxID=2527968 RepID=A0A518G6V8_9BACT|nr:DNA translocase FtsK [Aureliella helgolandensis]QDV24323.1 DNA translocase FtsK [Aureliella helgolandensis]
MTEQRRIEFDIEALLLAAVCVFLWLSLISYDPADSIGTIPQPLSMLVTIDASVYPPNAEIANACGWIGALCASVLVQTLGFGSIVVTLGLTVLTVWMFRVQNNYVRASRQLGWMFVIVAVTTFVTLVGAPTPLAPVIGPGGYLGALTAIWLNEHFAILGSLILTLTLLLAGLLLSTDYVVVRAASYMLMGSASVASSAAAATKKRVSIPAPGRPGRRPRSDVEEGLKLDEPAQGAKSGLPPVRIRGQQADDVEASVSAAEAPAAAATGLLGTAKAIAGGLLKPAAAIEPASEITGDAASTTTAAEVDDELEEDYDEEFIESDAVEFREVEVDGELLHTRADDPHESLPATTEGPRVRPPKSKSKKAEKQELSDSLAHLDDTKLPAGAEEYVLPGIDLLTESDDIDFESQTIEVRRKAQILEATFKDFGLNVKVVEIETGPVIAQYEIELQAGLRLSKITGLSDDLAIALRVPSVRIVAPIPGKNTVGIEVPNETRQVVRLREVIEEQGAKGKKAKIPLFLGKDVSGNALTADLASLPHLLIAGRTGTGKSVCLNAIIASILMTKKPDEVRMLMIDPKMVELSGYGRLPHLMHPVVTDMKKAEAILAWAVDKMEERYSLLARAGVRHLTSYNELGREELLDRLKPESAEEEEAIPDHLPFIVIVADEMADLMMTAGKEVEQHIIRLAQKSRAVGIHLILATQKPTVDVITGLIKSNLPARISFQVASRTDSRVVLDEMGADKLLGNGDMLFLWPGTSMLLRGQGTYLSDEEINAVVDHCSTGEQNFVNELVNLKINDEEGGEDAAPTAFKKRDELYSAAVDVVVREGRGSCSLLQRALGIGYGRAARLIDYMAEDGIVGQYAGSQARDVTISVSEWEAMQSSDGASGQADAITAIKPPARSNKIRPTEEPPATDAPQRSVPASKMSAISAAAAPAKRSVEPRAELTPAEDEQYEDEPSEEEDEYEEEDSQEAAVKTAAGMELDDEAEYEDYD